MVHEFYTCMYEKKTEGECWRSKVMVIEGKTAELMDFSTPYRVSVSAVGRCEVLLGEKMEEVKEFNYLRTCKLGEMERTIMRGL